MAQFSYGYDGIVLGVPNFKPYTYLDRGKITGSAIVPVKQALDDLDVPVTLRLYPTYTDLIKAIKRNEIQGFFLASQNEERDRYAQFSKPVTINNWAWFTLKEPKYPLGSDNFSHHALIGTIQKTNTFRWLVRNGYQAHGDLASKLPTLLMNRKLDAVFAAEAVFEKSSKESGISLRIFEKKVERGKPFGMYISRQYLKKNKGFMKKLDQYIEKNIFRLN